MSAKVYRNQGISSLCVSITSDLPSQVIDTDALDDCDNTDGSCDKDLMNDALSAVVSLCRSKTKKEVVEISNADDYEGSSLLFEDEKIYKKEVEEIETITGIFDYLCNYLNNGDCDETLFLETFDRSTIILLVEHCCRSNKLIRCGIKALLLRLYIRFEVLRHPIVDSISNHLQVVAHNMEDRVCIDELLILLRGIVKGSPNPFHKRIKILLDECILPLYGHSSLPDNSQTLLAILIGFVSDNPSLCYHIVTKLLSFISITNPSVSICIIRAIQTVLCFSPINIKGGTVKYGRIAIAKGRNENLKCTATETIESNRLTKNIISHFLNPILCSRSIVFDAVLSALNDVTITRHILALGQEDFTQFIYSLRAAILQQWDEVAKTSGKDLGISLISRYRYEHPDFADCHMKDMIQSIVRRQSVKLRNINNFWISIKQKAVARPSFCFLGSECSNCKNEEGCKNNHV